MSHRRKVCYITGTRADFGLMQSTLQRIQQSEALELSLIVTGSHLLPEYGLTVVQIEAAGLPIAMGNGTAEMKAIAIYVVGTVEQDGVAEAIDRYILGNG